MVTLQYKTCGWSKLRGAEGCDVLVNQLSGGGGSSDLCHLPIIVMEMLLLWPVSKYQCDVTSPDLGREMHNHLSQTSLSQLKHTFAVSIRYIPAFNKLV